MMAEEKAAPMLQHQDGEGGQLALDEVRLPVSDSTTTQHGTQGVSALLLRGKANAVPLALLVALTGLDRRELRRRIQKERHEGACICVNNRDGYYLAETEAERDACARSMHRRAAEVESTARAIERAEVG